MTVNYFFLINNTFQFYLNNQFLYTTNLVVYTINLCRMLVNCGQRWVYDVEWYLFYQGILIEEGQGYVR